MQENQKKNGRKFALIVIAASILIAGGFFFMKGKTSSEVTKLITQSLYYTKMGEYNRALDKLDEAELKGPSKDQQEIILQLRELLVFLKNNPDLKEKMASRLEELDKKLSGMGNKDGKSGGSEDEEKLKKQREEALKKQKELEELKAKQDALEREASAKEEEIEKRKEAIAQLKKDLKKNKKSKNKEEQLAKLKAMEEEQKRLEDEKKRLAKARKEEQDKLNKQIDEENKRKEQEKQLEDEKKRKDKEEKEAFNKALEKGKRLLADERYQDALEAFNNAEDLDKNNAEVKALKGITVLRLKQPDKARDLFNDAIRNNPNEGLAYAGLGELEYDKKNDSKAEDYYQQATSKENVALAYYRLGVLRLIKKDNNGALDAFNKAYHSPDLKDLEKNIRVKLFYNMGKANERIKESKEAVNYYKKAIDLDRNHENSYVALGQLYYDAKNYNESIYYAKKAYDINDNNYFALFLLGKSYDNQKDFKNAVYYYEKALKVKSSEEELFYNLGRANNFMKNYKDALTYLNKALNINRRSATYIQHGLALIGLKKYDEADVSFKEALNANPNDVDAYKGMAMAALSQNDSAKAESVLLQAVKINGKDFELWAKLGEIYFNRKDFNKSVDSYENAYRINPNKEVKFSLASSYLAAGKFDESEKMYKSVISEESSYVEAREGLADCFIAQKKLKEAKSELEEIVKRYPKYKNIKRVQNKIKQVEEVIKNS